MISIYQLSFCICPLTDATYVPYVKLGGNAYAQLWITSYFWGMNDCRMETGDRKPLIAGSLWYTQFFFYGLGHVRMGSFMFASWVLHMSMLIFFSYIIGVIMKEWKNVSKKTYMTLIVALFVLVMAFLLISYGSYIGELTTRH